MIEKYVRKYENEFYLALRILVGVMFFMHGSMKLFGWFSNQEPMALMSLMGLAGIIELLAGLGIALGFFTRLFALLGGVQMIIAYFMAHVPKGYNPLANGGELALMYLAAFLVFLVQGAKGYSLEQAVLKKEVF